ncbi:unnamed protein product [Lactuca saligna]|uniref:Uncharacterized protein n=1 Tax=Lactuca saligna TaxID=75948 RepID=A0AA36E721_LACSI|nr:unnamed protein product [Lactuca saligna]
MTILASAFEKNSSDGEVKCLMAHNVESHANTSHDSVGILNDDSPHTVDNLRSKRDDASAYQIKNHVNLSSIDNIENKDMIHLLRFNLLISNKRKSPLSLELKILKEKLIALEKSLSVLKRENTCISLTNNFLHTEKVKFVDHANHTQLILKFWASFHFNVTIIFNAQIPY